ncbi:hypothetical protein Holit_00567 [Hollandina sp. SP2]
MYGKENLWQQQPTYKTIIEWVKTNRDYTAQPCWIAHIKEQMGYPMKKAHNRKGSDRVKPCPAAKAAEIEDAINNAPYAKVTDTACDHVKEQNMAACQNCCTEDFRTQLRKILSSAEKQGSSKIQVNSGDLHRQMGGYPGQNHRMPMCCSAMRAEMQSGDEIIQGPPKGNGASLTIAYRLPR